MERIFGKVAILKRRLGDIRHIGEVKGDIPQPRWPGGNFRDFGRVGRAEKEIVRVAADFGFIRQVVVTAGCRHGRQVFRFGVFAHVARAAQVIPFGAAPCDVIACFDRMCLVGFLYIPDVADFVLGGKFRIG